MSLHLVKLCVGIERIDELRERQIWQKKNYKRLAHVTRNTPKRAEELLDGGSLYWVIKRYIVARQKLIKIESYKDDEGKNFCRLHLDDEIILTRPHPRRAFQGWRYLPASDAPPDISRTQSNLPDALRQELAELGLL